MIFLFHVVIFNVANAINLPLPFLTIRRIPESSANCLDKATIPGGYAPLVSVITVCFVLKLVVFKAAASVNAADLPLPSQPIRRIPEVSASCLGNPSNPAVQVRVIYNGGHYKVQSQRPRHSVLLC